MEALKKLKSISKIAEKIQPAQNAHLSTDEVKEMMNHSFHAMKLNSYILIGITLCLYFAQYVLIRNVIHS